MFKNAIVAATIAVFLVATTPTASPASAVSASFDIGRIDAELRGSADALVHATVGAVEYRTRPDGGVETLASLNITEVLEGAGIADLVLTVRGGIHPNGMVHRNSQAPWLEAGDEIVAALRRDAGADRYFVETDASVVHLNRHSSAMLPGTFALNGATWTPYPAAGIPYEINPAGSGESAAVTLAAVRSAFRSWENDLYSDITFDDRGTTARFGGVDAKNIVSWTPEPLFSESWLAVTDSYYFGDRLAEVDITFNTAYRWSTSPNRFESDIESTALHEIGHMIGLDHIDIQSAVMYRSIASGSIRRVLTENETAGAAHLYPRLCAGQPVTIAGGDGNETLSGTSGDDVIAAGGGDDIVNGSAGRDIICGEAGDDVLRGGTANDRLFGGTGRDRIYGEGGADRIDGGLDIDRIRGGEGADVIDGGGGSDRIWGDAENDTIVGGSGADRIWGGDGDDTLNGNGGQDTIWGDAGRDTIQGNFQSDELHGGAGRDVIRGAGGKDRLYGEDDNDDLNGGANSDMLMGGPGFDIVNGGPGRDTCDATSGDALTSC